MANRLTIVGLGGSLAQISRSRAALQVALDGAANAGAETELLDLHELELPIYNSDNDEPTPAAARLIESCYAADGMLWSSPVYQGTISGAFKNALDWLHVLGGRKPPFLHDKVIGPHQRRRRNAGTASDQHDGVRRPRAQRMGGPVRRSGCGRGTHLRCDRPDSGSSG
jgi:NAD(P)H-dependent FMN reductase